MPIQTESRTTKTKTGADDNNNSVMDNEVLDIDEVGGTTQTILPFRISTIIVASTVTTIVVTTPIIMIAAVGMRVSRWNRIVSNNSHNNNQKNHMDGSRNWNRNNCNNCYC